MGKYGQYFPTDGFMTRDEQAELSEIGLETCLAKVASSFDVDTAAMVKAFCKPRTKVGTEWVTKGQNIEQARGAT